MSRHVERCLSKVAGLWPPPPSFPSLPSLRLLLTSGLLGSPCALSSFCPLLLAFVSTHSLFGLPWKFWGRGHVFDFHIGCI